MWQEEDEPGVCLWPFHHPLPVLGTDPDAGPQLCVSFNAGWLRVILGALNTLMERHTWDESDPAALYLQQQRSYALLKLFALAELCPVQEDGIATLSIVAGEATATALITFSGVYTAIPKVDVSCDNGDLIASWHDVTLLDCILRITAATPVAVDTVANVSWSTNP